MRKQRHLVSVLSSINWRTHPAHVTMQAARMRGQIQRHLAHVLISRRHVPHLPIAIPINRRLKHESIISKQISETTPPRSNVVKQLAPAVNRVVTVAIKTQPRAAVVSKDLVMHSGRRMREV